MRLFLIILAGISLLTGFGCGKESAAQVTEVKITSGAGQCVPSGGKTPDPVQIRLLGKGPRRFTGNSPLLPVPGIRVCFRSPAGARVKIPEVTAVSDAGGIVQAVLEAPRHPGEHLVEIIPEGFEERKKTIKLYSGIRVAGTRREYLAGHTSEEPVTVTVTRGGKGVAGVPVYFSFGRTVEGTETTARILTPEAVTDERGKAFTFIRAGEKTGVYQLNIDVVSPEHDIYFQGVTAELHAVSPLSVTVCALGGMAFFLLGMVMMSDGIRQAAGENMRKILSCFTGNRVSALLAGTLVTAIIQSSAATTVMVIGFINAGLLTLVQSMGIIFGANIGTTVTAQLISFDLSALSLPCVAAGFFMTLFKKRGINAWGSVLLGFGLLFFGMSMMSNELKVLGEMNSVRSFFALFNCAPAPGHVLMPVGAVLGATVMGALFTVLLQSSSAFAGVVLALAAGQLVDFYTAVPLLIGSNIGTTVTAQLGALNANRVAKQAALAHTLFNVLGAAAVLLICAIPWNGRPAFLYLVNALTPGDAFAPVPQNLERHIAMFHTIFNIAVAVALLPFARQFAGLCSRLIPVLDKVRNRTLEPALLNTPSVALKLSSNALEVMVKDGWQMIGRAVNEHFLTGDRDEAKYEELAEAESGIDRMQSDLTAYLVQLTRRRLTDAQAALIPLLMHCTNDAERVADHCETILQLNDRMVMQEKTMSDTAREELKQLWTLLDELARQVISGLDGREQITRAVLKQRMHKVHALADQFEAEHIDRLRQGSCTAGCGVIFIEMLGEMVKIAERLANIAERTPEIRAHYVNL